MKVKSDPRVSASSGAVKGISTPRDREKWQNEEVKTLGYCASMLFWSFSTELWIASDTVVFELLVRSPYRVVPN